MSNPEFHTCPDCGYQWRHGYSGDHYCMTELRKSLTPILDSANAPAGPLVDRVRWVVERSDTESKQWENVCDKAIRNQADASSQVIALHNQLAASQATNARLVELLRAIYCPGMDTPFLAKRGWTRSQKGQGWFHENHGNALTSSLDAIGMEARIDAELGAKP